MTAIGEQTFKGEQMLSITRYARFVDLTLTGSGLRKIASGYYQVLKMLRKLCVILSLSNLRIYVLIFILFYREPAKSMI